DPRAVDVTRATFTRGDRVVFVAIGRYHPRNDPDWRPSINLIAPAIGAASVSHDRLSIGIGSAGPPLPVNLVSVRRPGRELSVLYWYQVGDRSIAGGLRLRLALLENALRLKGQEVWLVRIATPTRERPDDFLRTLHPWLVKALSR